MKILMAHNQYREPGGEDISVRLETEMLRRNGCDVDLYIEDNARVDQLGAARTAMGAIWSWQTYWKIRDLLRSKRIDLLHVQNFFPLISPSIYYAARAEGVPVVQSLRNYRLLCPAATMYRDGQVCEKCTYRKIAWPAVRDHCYRDSTLGSLAISGMLAFHHMLGTWYDSVDAYITMSEFMRGKFVQAGFPPEKLFFKPNFLWPEPSPGKGGGDFVVFAGRLTAEKGIKTLLEAWEIAKPPIVLKLVGDGPLSDELREVYQSSSVEFLGWRPEQEVLDLMGAARFVIIPSAWFEGHPRTLIEAFARATPVIASRIGALSEIVEDQRTGLLFEPGDSRSLAAKIGWALEHSNQMADMGANGRAVYEREYTVGRNYDRLIGIYEHVIAARQKLATSAVG